MKKKFWAVGALTAATLLASLTACASPGTSSSSSTGASEWPSQTASLKGVTLTLWAAQTTTAEAKTVISGFEKATGATVKVVTIPDPYEQNVETKIATGAKPDLAFWQPTASELATINPGQNLLSLNGAPWLSTMTPGINDVGGTYDGTRYAALVTSPSLMGVYYNKQVFAHAGITTTPANWDEMIADAKQIKAKTGIAPFYEAGHDQWPTQYWVQVQLADASKNGLWTDMNSRKQTFSDSTILGAITNYDNLIKQGLFNSNIKTATFVQQGQAMLAGQTAMVVQVNAYLQELQASADTAELTEKVGWFPISPNGNTATSIPDQTNAVVAFNTGNAKQEDAAREFLEYWMGKGYASFISSQGTVSVESSVPNPSGVPDALVAIQKAVPGSAGSMQSLAVANPDLYINLADMIQGTKTPQQVASTTQQQFDQLANAQGVKGF